MKEEWRDVIGFEDFYEISNLGRLRSKTRYISVTNFKGTAYKRMMPAQIIRPSDNGHGYLRAVLTDDNRKCSKYIHRLVAEAFLSNPKNLSDVNHRDQNTHNNVVSNLEWMSRLDNINYGDRTERAGRTQSRTKQMMRLCRTSITMDSSTKRDKELSILWDI